ncbi:phenylacetate--CoA ligase [Amycolatopsis antarctica]|uniref:Phenylacetate--CoA ligase n=1 Tax=Amycolatopsis antarctica TaxID=1854586 RepID=A0A263D3G9_9PSEU|nr:AMP-binding protein [Amycolatopsis antarctica]OZM71905.1 phenylacetate--CoA ligase [Amycolatopsis antarctica]
MATLELIQPVAGAEYWHPRTETMPREELRQWQWRKLRQSLRLARRSPFWSARIPENIGSLDEYFERVPLVYKSDLIAAQETAPPYGILPSTDPALAIRHSQTSGTSGNPPVRSFDTARDWAWSVDVYATALYGMGVRARHRGMVAFGYGLFVGFWGMHYALERIGAQAVPIGGLDSETRVRLLIDLRIDVLGCTPSYAMRLLETAREMGVDLARDGNVRIIMAGGEPRSDLTTQAIANGFGARVFNAAGTTELGTVNMFECPHRPGCCHIIESAVIEEVLDPETRQPVGYGEQGVRVSTGIGREGMQLFRHWTEDLVVKRPWHECGCGRTWDYLDRGILGRADDMRKIRGVSVTPVMVEEVVRGFPEVDEFQTNLRTVRGLDTVVLRVEPNGDAGSDLAALGERISNAMKRIIGLRPEVEFAAPGSLPRFEVKAARFHDERSE